MERKVLGIVVSIPIPFRGEVRRMLIDEEDYNLIKDKHLFIQSNGTRNYYAWTLIDGKKTYIHRLILKGCRVDHINGNGLDNRKENLRAASVGQNAANNRKRKGTSSRFKGVSYTANSRGKPWRAALGRGKRYRYGGCFKTEEEAARAYDKLLLEMYGEYALTNEKMGLL